jgi:hypothetical protein
MPNSASKLGNTLMSCDLERSRQTRRAALRSLYGLTPAEFRVALLLGHSHAPGQIANAVGVTKNTAHRSKASSPKPASGGKATGPTASQ